MKGTECFGLLIVIPKEGEGSSLFYIYHQILNEHYVHEILEDGNSEQTIIVIIKLYFNPGERSG